jgi:proteic killer suppression protein
MIINFKHRGLERYFTNSDHRGIPALHLSKINRQLDRLDAATKADDMNIPGWNFHRLKGKRKNEFAVTVYKNWRITFEFKDDNAINVNLEDYH